MDRVMDASLKSSHWQPVCPRVHIHVSSERNAYEMIATRIIARDSREKLFQDASSCVRLETRSRSLIHALDRLDRKNANIILLPASIGEILVAIISYLLFAFALRSLWEYNFCQPTSTHSSEYYFPSKCLSL